MSDLARFRLGFNGMLVSDIDGDWVSYRGHADEIARLTQRVAELSVFDGSACAEEQAIGNGPCGICVTCLRTRLAECERDAARYRWLRAEHDRVDPLARCGWKYRQDRNGHQWVDLPNGGQLDHMIDAAMGDGT